MQISLNPLKSCDKYFLICNIITMLVCLPWPLTVIATIMSLAGHVPSGTPALKMVFVRTVECLALIYPVIYLAVVFFAERVVAPHSYPIAETLATLPAAFSLFVIADCVLA